MVRRGASRVAAADSAQVQLGRTLRHTPLAVQPVVPRLCPCTCAATLSSLPCLMLAAPQNLVVAAVLRWAARTWRPAPRVAAREAPVSQRLQAPQAAAVLAARLPAPAIRQDGRWSGWAVGLHSQPIDQEEENNGDVIFPCSFLAGNG